MRGGNPKPHGRNPEIMQAAIDAVRDGLGVQEAARVGGFQKTQMSHAFAVLRDAPDLSQKVLNGELSLYKAHQIATKGEMQPCPVCGNGYVFRKRRG